MANNAFYRGFINRSKKEAAYIESEKSIIAYLTSLFNNEKFLSHSDNKYLNSTIFQGILFVLTNRRTDFNSVYMNTVVYYGMSTGFFDSSKARLEFNKGNVSGAFSEINKLCLRKFANIESEINNIYKRILACLFSYFDFDKYLKNRSNKKDIETLFESLYFYCLINVICGVISKDTLKDLPTDPLGVRIKFERISQSSYNAFSNNHIKTEYLSFNSDKQRLNEFVTLLNEFLLHKDNVFDDKKYFNLSNYTLDWSLLFMKDSEFAKKDITLKNAFDVKEVELYSQIMAYEKGVSYFTSSFTQFIYAVTANISADYMKKILSSNSEKVVSLDTELKELKSSNKSLNKSIGKLEAEYKKAQETIELNQQKIEELRQVEISQEKAEEFDNLKSEVASLTEKYTSSNEDLRKAQNKVDWQEHRILELEGNIKFYADIENSMLILQNENNVLKSQIEQIECLESSEDSEAVFQKKLSAIKDEPILFIGGTGNIMLKFRELFPNSEYIDISDQGTNFIVPTRIKWVVIYTRMVTHSHCDRAESFVSKDKIIPINILNSHLVVEELYRVIVENK